MVKIGIAGTGRRQNGIGRVDIVAAHVVVVLFQIIAVARPDIIKYLRLHGKTGDEARHVIRRAPEQAAGFVRNFLVRQHAAAQSSWDVGFR